MERLKKFIPSIIAFAPKAILLSVILAILGVLAERKFISIATPPWITIALFISATLTLAYNVYRYWIFKNDVPYPIQRMFKREHIEFKEIAETVSKNYPNVYNKEEVLHQLLKPFWQGEFEWSSGAFAKIKSTDHKVETQKTHKIKIIKTGASNKYIPNHTHLKPAMCSLNRRDLLKPDMGIHKIYPGFDTLQQEVSDEESISWSELRNKIDFELLASMKPDEYSQDYIQNYVHHLTIDGPTLQQWFQRFQSGKYQN